MDLPEGYHTKSGVGVMKTDTTITLVLEAGPTSSYNVYLVHYIFKMHLLH